ncbi:MAG TPA: CUAEP/CCAEP-tail radical SAM protein [Thermomicrobiales bacterium]|nr:CUAEP/CCAEP-tail radical SAM protein [Thermomicrobiales bacterium]
MRGDGEILLVSTYELGHQPLNLASPLAYLARAGYRPVAVDTAVEELADEVIARARLVAISVPMHTALRLGVAIAARVRAVNPAAHVCCYGLYAALNADYLLDGRADAVIGGEYEQPLLDLAARLEAGDDAPPSVGTRARRAAPHLARLSFAVPAREALPPLRRYAALERDGAVVPAGYVEASRGCLHTCLHCPITPVYGGRFFVVPRAVVLADIAAQVAAGARHITFGDPDFLNGPGHVLRILREMRAAWPDLTFDATIKIEHILEQRRLFPELAALGCAFVVSAVESLSDEVLRRLDKGHTRADVVEALDILDAAGIPMRPSLLPFTPWTTLDDYLDLLDFFAARDLLDHVDPVHFSIRLLVPPGSALLDQPDTATWLGPLDAANFTHTWRHPDPRVDDLQRAVAATVEAAERDGADPVETFAAIEALAHTARGALAPRRRGGVLTARGRVPRLTESWFC